MKKKNKTPPPSPRTTISGRPPQQNPKSRRAQEKIYAGKVAYKKRKQMKKTNNFRGIKGTLVEFFRNKRASDPEWADLEKEKQDKFTFSRKERREQRMREKQEKKNKD